MEFLIKDDVTSFLENSDLLSKVKYGFQRGRSCLTNLLEAFESWTNALDDGFGVDIVYLDYRKTFDTVSHNKLIEQLQYYGICGRLLV